MFGKKDDKKCQLWIRQKGTYRMFSLPSDNKLTKEKAQDMAAKLLPILKEAGFNVFIDIEERVEQ